MPRAKTHVKIARLMANTIIDVLEGVAGPK